MTDASEIEQLLQRYATGRYRPATFLERGVALPLTTPQLLGARVRPAPRRGLELVVPHPAGGDGVYILPWSAIGDFCAPSLHDRILWDRVAALTLLSPGTVRDAARRVAAEGYAGRAAARAAAQAADCRLASAAQVQFELLLMVIRQGEPPNNPLPPAARDNPANIQLRVRGALKRHANRVNPVRALEVVEEVAGAFSQFGFRPEAESAPLIRLTRDLRGMADAITLWAGLQPPEDRQSAQLIVAATDMTLRAAERSIAEARSLVTDVWEMMHRWDAEADRVRALAIRPEWVLDGWDRMLALWLSAGAAGQLEALADMALLVPVTPAEARDGLGFDAEGDSERQRNGLRTWRRTVLARQDWLTGRFAPQQERCEAMLEACA
jgi:hypothetical protein